MGAGACGGLQQGFFVLRFFVLFCCIAFGVSCLILLLFVLVVGCCYCVRYFTFLGLVCGLGSLCFMVCWLSLCFRVGVCGFGV